MKDPFSEVYKNCRKFEKIDFPRLVDIELTNNCNMTCDMCPTGNGTAKRKKGFMAGNVWHLVLKELAEHQTPIRFIRWGEPTLHKNLYDWISEAKEGGLLTHINTNGELLDAQEVLDCGLDSIKLSVHGELQQSFMQLADYVMLKRGKDKKPYMYAHYYTPDEPKTYCEVIKYVKPKDLTKPPKAYHRCPEVYNKLSINWDGTVSACCADYDNLMVVGDIKNTSLEYIWNSSEMAEYRRRLDRLEHAKLKLCRNCSCEM